MANIAVGYNNLDLAACTRHGVLATNTPDVLNEATADHAWALLLAAARRVGESERWLRAGLWKRWTFEMFMGAEISGTTLGILGMGRIGRAIARRAAGFRMPVIYHNRTRLSPDAEGGARVCRFRRVAARGRSPGSRRAVLAGGAPPDRRGGAGADEAHARCWSISRAAESSTTPRWWRRCAPGALAAAGLDVFENEPALHPGLLELENVVLTPHIASSTRATRAAMARLAISNLRAALGGDSPALAAEPRCAAQSAR